VYTYNARNRLSKVQIGTTTADTVTYKINAMGQRYQKVGAGQYAYSTTATINTATGQSPQSISLNFNTRYVHDEQGRILGEYSPEGKLIAETIWFNDLPVATLRPKGSSNQLPLGITGTGATTANNVGNNTTANKVNVDVFYVHADHLGTPRVVTRSVAVGGATTGPNAINKQVWSANTDPFGTSLGNSAPNENPQLVSGTPTVVQANTFRQNLAFPGQIRDAETGKSYNYFRDYDPSVGRYVESDPIGLRAGLNTFGYVGQSPTHRVDKYGLKSSECLQSGLCGDCPSSCGCPGGRWLQSFGDFQVSVGAGLYLGLSDVTVRCSTNPSLTCSAKQVCVGGFAGATVMYGVGGNIFGTVTGAPNACSLGGWGGMQGTFSGGPFSGQGDLDGNGQVGIGLGAGLGAGGIRCNTYAVKCSCMCGAK
jgi:RHS repeat-associated protein